MWDLKVIDTNKSLYIAIAEAIERDIKLGVLKPGQKMPTHRGLAKKVGVNVTTVTRAYKEAERQGYLTAIIGSGTFVTADLGIYTSLTKENEIDDKVIDLSMADPVFSVEDNAKKLIENLITKKDLTPFLQYCPPQGILSHRQIGVRWVKQFGIDTSADNVIITSGAQHAFVSIFHGLFKNGDRIAVDYLTYPNVKAAAKRCGIKLEGVMMDEEGMLPEDLTRICRQHEIKGVYTFGYMQNPTNAIMSEKRKKELVKVFEQEDLILIEDDTHGFLSETRLSPLCSYLPQRCIYISSLSKAFYSGLRVCFLTCPQRFRNKIVQAVIDTIWMTPPLVVEIACQTIETGLAKEIMKKKKQELKTRFQLFEKIMGGYQFQYAPYNMFVWLRLPEDWNQNELVRIAKEYGVSLLPTDKFIVGSSAVPNFLRVSLSAANSTKDLERGLIILKKILEYELTGSVEGIL